MSTPAIEAHKLVVKLGRKTVLDDLNLRVESGQVTVLLGQNGAGKTTLLRLAMGLLRPKQGKIQTDLDILATRDALFVTVAPGQAKSVASALDRMLIMEDAELADRSEELSCVRVHGAGAAQWLEDHGPVLGSAQVNWTAAGGACAIINRSELSRLAEQAAPSAWTQLRVERGFGVIGVDYDASDNPHEAALDRIAVSFSKGCYLGQEVVCMQDMRGKLKRRLCIVKVADAELSPGMPVSHESAEVGDVRSVAPKGGLCLARISAPHFEPGTELRVGGASAQVVEPPAA